MKAPVLGFRIWRVAKPTRQLTVRRQAPGRVDVPYRVIQPEQEPGTLLPIMRRKLSHDTWTNPGPVKFVCPLYTPHERPAWSHECGLYASLTLQQTRTRGLTGDYVVGAVIAWGRVIIHGTEGFRAEYAQVVALSPPPDPKIKGQWARKAAMRLGVPCVPFERLEQVGREFGNPIRWEYRFDA
jgi:hypothetical protein